MDADLHYFEVVQRVEKNLPFRIVLAVFGDICKTIVKLVKFPINFDSDPKKGIFDKIMSCIFTQRSRQKIKILNN